MTVLVMAGLLIFGLAAYRLLPVSTLPKVIEQWRAPAHPEFQPRNTWSLFNAFTEALKGNLPLLPRRTQALHGLMDAHVGLAGRN